MYMTKSIESTTAKTTTVEKLLTVADVARELKLDAKRARSYLRKNAAVYAPFRNKTFAKNTALYNKCRDALRAMIPAAKSAAA